MAAIQVLGAAALAALSKLINVFRDDTTGAGSLDFLSQPTVKGLPFYDPNGHGRLTWLASSGARLVRFNGCTIPINGASYVIPVNGINILPASCVESNTGNATGTAVVANTRYFVYAYYDTASASIALTMSTTAPSISSATGLQIKSDDVTRTLVGLFYCSTASSFAVSASGINMISWFCQRDVSVALAVSEGPYAGTSPAYAFSTAVVTWAENPIRADLICHAHASGVGEGMFVGISLDGALSVANVVHESATNYEQNMSLGLPISTSVGNHSIGVAIYTGDSNYAMTLSGTIYVTVKG